MADIKLSDIAKYANVSTATVSNVINGTRPVSASMRKIVLEAMEALNYHPPQMIKSDHLDRDRNFTIGVIVTSTRHVFFGDVLSGIYRMAGKYGYNVAVYSSEDSFEREKQLVRHLAGRGIDGILINSLCNSEDYEYLRYLANLSKRKRRIPVVSIDRNFVKCGVSSAFVDGYTGAKMATRHLAKRGCHRIACISGAKLDEATIERYRGFVYALGESGIKLDEACVARGDYTSVNGYRAMKRMLINGIKPDGVFCFNDQMAIGAMKAANEYGLKCPEQIKIVGYDNIFVASVVMPQLTTINVPRFRMGEEAFSLLYEEMVAAENGQEGKHKANGTELLSDLIVRQSTDINAIFSTWDLEGW